MVPVACTTEFDPALLDRPDAAGVESDCGNSVDDDMDGRTDCEDPGCNGERCGIGCVCDASERIEIHCFDEEDNDLDDLADCEDPDCEGVASSDGWRWIECRRVELDCDDTEDNEGDGLTDCGDPDCEGRHCGEAGNCTAGACI